MDEGLTDAQKYAKLNVLIEFQEVMSKRAQSVEEAALFRQTMLFLRIQQTRITKRILIDV